MMGEGAAQRQRALLEVVMVMGRDLVALPRTNAWRQVIDHEGRAAIDPPETRGIFRDIQRVPSDLEPTRWLRPGFERRHVWVRLPEGVAVGCRLRHVGGLRGKEPDDGPRRHQADPAGAWRYEDDGIARNGRRSILRGDFDRRFPVGDDHRIFVSLLLAGKDAVLPARAVGDDEILAPADPGLSGLVGDLRRLLVKQAELRAEIAAVQPGLGWLGGIGKAGSGVA